MRVIGVIGPKKSGKTTLICDILKRLKEMNINVATIKHSTHDVKVDREGTDSYKFKQCSNVSVIADNNKTAFFYDKMDLCDILPKLNNNDFVIVEGFKEQLKELNIPKILMVKEDEGSELWDSQTVMVIKDYNYNIDEVMEKVLEKSIVPTYNLNCGHCGYNCKIFVEKVVSGELKWNQCVASSGVEMVVNGKTIPMNPFVSDIIKNTLKGIVGSLKGADNPKTISINIKDI
ncbi:molybdopterin-guanine dinucleotide biosynthesis protein B [Methanothermococcus okinawensis]|uniref:Molybdopterin-guanine dinucleotide biosynthesis protein B n=1 Tax=Methanothermococcus okinawensis (strain DSM 14208 / JCM 11175 / IH1) TaxID=647113 RepID=F8ANI2_METOI|nr:molybdopterin-guanine dinucleotide biosynthesis protein B [Methanothermococcus okinawensis]AEH07036.1 molybdopterin-guanine dinucleotide biosynthesis protein B [Methanothermococcus okinawensis IH1]